MLGSFLSGLLIFIFAYVYPAYECYKTVELNKPEIDKLRFWCQYWILVAFLAVILKFADFFLSWLPLYCEVKLALYIFLWYPKLRGTSYFYDTFFRPFIAKYETDIDRHLLELRTRVADLMMMCILRASNYGRSSLFEMMKNVTGMVQTPIARHFQQTQDSQQSSEKPREAAVKKDKKKHHVPPPPAAPPSPRSLTPRQSFREKSRLQSVGFNDRSDSSQDQEKKLAPTQESATKDQEERRQGNRSDGSQDGEGSKPQAEETSVEFVHARHTLRKRTGGDAASDKTT